MWWSQVISVLTGLYDVSCINTACTDRNTRMPNGFDHADEVTVTVAKVTERMTSMSLSISQFQNFNIYLDYSDGSLCSHLRRHWFSRVILFDVITDWFACFVTCVRCVRFTVLWSSLYHISVLQPCAIACAGKNDYASNQISKMVTVQQQIKTV